MGGSMVQEFDINQALDIAGQVNEAGTLELVVDFAQDGSIITNEES